MKEVSGWKGCYPAAMWEEPVERLSEALLLQQWLLSSVYEEDAVILYYITHYLLRKGLILFVPNPSCGMAFTKFHGIISSGLTFWFLPSYYWNWEDEEE